ncbi:hypothetical protein HDU80_010374 [Chytriomyces hyalinus]|nr:hypothetical protein HDU80_010374 [Chytriomyces hyalinus]
MNSEFTQIMSALTTVIISALENPIQIIFYMAILAVMWHLRQEIHSFKQAQSTSAGLSSIHGIFETLLQERDAARAKINSITVLNEKLARERDAARAEASTVRRLLHVKERAQLLHAKRITGKNGACHMCQSSTHIPVTPGPSNDLISRVRAPISSPVTTPSSSTQAPLVPPTLPVSTTEPAITQVALAAEAHQGPISRQVSVAGAQSVATPTITPVTSATQSSPVLVTPTRVSKVASTHSNQPSPLSRVCILATPSPTDATRAAAVLLDRIRALSTPTKLPRHGASASKSTTPPVQANVAAAVQGLISRVSAATAHSTPSRLPRAVSAMPSPLCAVLTPHRIPLPSPDKVEKAFFSEKALR